MNYVDGNPALAGITQHDAVWVLIILGIIALLIYIVARFRP